MSKYIIHGNKRLEGELKIQGSKNAALPIMAACVLNSGVNVLHNVPDILDVRIMIKILDSIGCIVKREGGSLIVDSSGLTSNLVSEHLVSQMRSSIMLLGALLAKQKEVEFSYPGGCDIGLRPIDIHLKGLRELGAEIKEEHGYIIVHGYKMESANIVLNYPSVGATENMILASIFTKGVTSVANAAKEPEIIDLQNFLNKMGARVYGAGTNTIYIEGVSELHDCEYTIMTDRIVSGTMLCGVHMTGGSVFMRDLSLDTIKAPYYKLIESGLKLKTYHNGVLAESNGEIQALDSIVTLPYPGFPTDLQSPFVSMLARAKGTSLVKETVFESRFKYSAQLVRMGANIKIEGRIAIITGVEKLSSASVYAEDLRGGASLVLAALCADGQSVVENAHHVNRGYENLAANLSSIGADIKYIN